MQTLNVGAGRTEAEYQEAKEQQRADLLAESKRAANFFFVAAGVAALGTGLLPIRLFGITSIGVFDMLMLYGRPLGPLYGITLLAIACLWLLVLIGLGFAGRAGQRWAFFVGIALYALDMMALVPLFSMWAFGVHGFFVYQWFQGQKALKEMGQP